jgi:hypothetical protein
MPDPRQILYPLVYFIGYLPYVFMPPELLEAPQAISLCRLTMLREAFILENAYHLLQLRKDDSSPPTYFRYGKLQAYRQL